MTLTTALNKQRCETCTVESCYFHPSKKGWREGMTDGMDISPIKISTFTERYGCASHNMGLGVGEKVPVDDPMPVWKPSNTLADIMTCEDTHAMGVPCTDNCKGCSYPNNHVSYHVYLKDLEAWKLRHPVSASQGSAKSERDRVLDRIEELVKQDNPVDFLPSSAYRKRVLTVIIPQVREEK